MKSDKDIINFWKDIIYKNGKIDEEQVMKELEDYYNIIQNVSKVYNYITNGQLSKPYYESSVIISLFEENYLDKAITKSDVQDMINRANTYNSLEELIEELEDYFKLYK